MPIPGQDIAFDKTNFYLTKLQNVSPEASKIKQLLNSHANNEKILDYWKSVKDFIANVDVKRAIHTLAIKPIQRAVGKISPVTTTQDSQDRTNAINFVMSLRGESDLKGTRSMIDSLPKGVAPSQIRTRSQHIYATLDKLIHKLAALQQPLGIRPDYDSGMGTTGDISERLRNIKESLSENDAAMLKMIPPMKAPGEESQQCPCETPEIADYDEGPQPKAEGPKIIVVENYGEESDVPCCSGCGQALPARTAKEADTMDRKFRAIRDTIKKCGLKETQLKIIHSNLDAIYDKYRTMQKKDGED